MNWLEFEQKAANNGYKYVCGVDEAGRGPLAGPVCAAAVILPKDTIIEGVNDSKKLSELLETLLVTVKEMHFLGISETEILRQINKIYKEE